MQLCGRSGLVLGFLWLVACGVEQSGDDSLGAGPRFGPSSGDAGSRTALPDGGAARDGESDAPVGPPPRPTGPGAPPTRSAEIVPDAQGFFELRTQASGLAYWARLPVGFDPSVPQQLVVGLHGCGDNAKHFAEWAIVPYALRETQSYVALSLGGRDGGCWSLEEDEAKVLEAVADVRQLFFIHQKKVTVAGYSSGGMLAYYTGLRNAYTFAGILIENSGMPFGDATDAVLAAAEWKLNVALNVHLQDANFPPSKTRDDRDRLSAAGFPVQFRELDGSHDGTSANWAEFLLPKIAGFVAP